MSMLYYTAVCEGKFNETPPFTLFVKNRSGDALVWNQGIQQWQYDPARVDWFTSDDRNWERYEPVDRAAAEAFSRQLAVDGSSISELPSEEWIEWFFSWKGDPPSHEDVSWDDDLYVREAKEARRQQLENGGE
ncbi:hypothetical protein ACFVMC_28440 [Nocardia sp. NPDC127579]|uniref:hypothetical protein n=1 Tax=Nocardia sp. NPDC127579 TaxID=3345402 RepID=UPI003628A66B